MFVTTSGTKDPADTDLTAAQKTFYGISQLPGQKASPEMKGCENLLGRSLEEAHGGQINELLGDLRSKCTAASTRLNTIADQLERECENPDLREWEYTTYPQVCLREPFPLQLLPLLLWPVFIALRIEVPLFILGSCFSLKM